MHPITRSDTLAERRRVRSRVPVRVRIMWGFGMRGQSRFVLQCVRQRRARAVVRRRLAERSMQEAMSTWRLTSTTLPAYRLLQAVLSECFGWAPAVPIIPTDDLTVLTELTNDSLSFADADLLIYGRGSPRGERDPWFMEFARRSRHFSGSGGTLLTGLTLHVWGPPDDHKLDSKAV